MVLGEGGAMMVMEPLEAAKARGAQIYAEICGLGMTSDAYHLTQPTAEGPALESFLATERAASSALDGRSVFGWESDLAAKKKVAGS